MLPVLSAANNRSFIPRQLHAAYFKPVCCSFSLSFFRCKYAIPKTLLRLTHACSRRQLHTKFDYHRTWATDNATQRATAPAEISDFAILAFAPCCARATMHSINYIRSQQMRCGGHRSELSGNNERNVIYSIGNGKCMGRKEKRVHCCRNLAGLTPKNDRRISVFL